METSTGLNLPWRLLKDKLVTLDSKNQLVKYSTTFDKINDHDIINVSNFFFGVFLNLKVKLNFVEYLHKL